MKTPSQAPDDVFDKAIATAEAKAERKRRQMREASARYRAKVPGAHREKMRKWRAEHPERAKELSREWRNKKFRNATPEEEKALREAESAKTRRLSAVVKEQVFSAYGGYRCNCCGETEPSFLSIDHVRNDGAQMRRDKLHGRSGTAFYVWLRRTGFPEGFQVLCMNCQFGKHKNGGICPHQGKV